MTVSELLHILVDCVDDGMGYLDVYMDDKPVESHNIRTVYPPCDGTFEPFQQFVLSSEKEE